MKKLQSKRVKRIQNAAKKYGFNPNVFAPWPKDCDVDEEFLRALPKAELHLHSTAMSDILTTAPLAWKISEKTDQGLQKNQEHSGSLEKLIQDFLYPKQTNLEEYLKRYDLLKNYIIRDLNAIRETSYQGAMQAFENGVRILEIRTSIKGGKYGDLRSKEVAGEINYTPFEELCARIEGFRKAEKESKNLLRVFLIISFRRQDSVERSESLLNDIVKYREQIKEKFGQDYIVGVDIAGQEYLSKARKFEPVFRQARKQGLLVTAHAGEEKGPGEGSIWQAINSGAKRIGHGTCLYRPTPLLPEEVRYASKGYKKNAFILSLMFGVPFEMCLTSNLVCGAEVTLGYEANPEGRPIPITKTFEDFSDYPAEILLLIGTHVYHGRPIILPIPCTDAIYTLNTDLAREYALAAKTFGLDKKVLLAVARFSIRHSFAPDDVKAKALNEWRDFASKYLNDPKFSTPDQEAKHALHQYRQNLREKLGISSKQIEEILQEVHSSKLYLKDYLYERFHQQNELLGV